MLTQSAPYIERDEILITNGAKEQVYGEERFEIFNVKIFDKKDKIQNMETYGKSKH